MLDGLRVHWPETVELVEFLTDKRIARELAICGAGSELEFAAKHGEVTCKTCLRMLFAGGR